MFFINKFGDMDLLWEIHIHCLLIGKILHFLMFCDFRHCMCYEFLLFDIFTIWYWLFLSYLKLVTKIKNDRKVKGLARGEPLEHRM